MHRQVPLTFLLLTILISSWAMADVHASSVNYSIHGEKISVALSLHFFQNATEMPILSTKYAGSSAQSLTQALEEGIRKKMPSASVSSLSGELVSSRDWINTTIRFGIDGTSTRKGDLLVSNCSWVPFNVSRDLRFGNLSYNLIGATYIRPTFARYIDFDKAPLNETIAQVTYLLGQNEIPAKFAVQRAGNATLLDFTSLGAPIQGWFKSYNLTKDMTTWVYNPGPALNMTMTVTPRDGRPLVSHAFYRYNATLSVDGLAEADGETVRIDWYGAYDPLIMLGVIIASLVVAIVASWKYRSRRREMPRRRK